MNRRAFISLLMSSAVAHTLDIDKLLWVPGQKTIFIPSAKQAEFLGMNYQAIIACEMERIAPRIRELFECDDMFYRQIKLRDTQVIGTGDIRIPISPKYSS